MSKYHKTTQKAVNKFFKKKHEDSESEEDGSESESESDDETDYKQVEKKTRPTGPYFDIINPINTIAGPIGEFQCIYENFPVHAAVALFGKRRTGKSYTLRWWMYNCFRHIPFGCVFTNTTINGFWQKYVPSWLVCQGLEMHRMNALIQRQKKLIAAWKKEHPEECEKNPDAYKEAPELAAFCILDDVIADRVAMQWNKEINTFFVEGRHLCITVFITTQHVKGVGPMIRGNMDIVCFQPIFQREARMTLADLYGGFMDRQEFITLMDQIVMNEHEEGSTPRDPKMIVQTMVCNDFDNCHDPQVKFKYARAENPDDIEPGWHLCADEYWKQQENDLGGSGKGSEKMDPCDMLEQEFGCSMDK